MISGPWKQFFWGGFVFFFQRVFCTEKEEKFSFKVGMEFE
jgi:hypothetical protein